MRLLSCVIVALMVGWASTATAQEGAAAKAGQSPETYQVQFDTTAGPIVVEVTREWAPLGSDRFYELVKSGYYDDQRIFRVLNGFVAQFGMSGDPKVNAEWSAKRIPDDPVTQTNAPGTLTFATSGENSRTTQLFINLGNNTRLDQMGFAPFGKIVEGMESVKKIYAGYGEAPNQGGIATQGNAYLDRQFPNLTKIESAKVISENGEKVGTASVK